MVFAAMMVFMIERKFQKAAQWCFAASAFSFLGLIHAYRLTESGIQNKFGLVAAPEFGILYALFGGILLLLHYRQKSETKTTRRKKSRGQRESIQKTNNVGYL